MAHSQSPTIGRRFFFTALNALATVSKRGAAGNTIINDDVHGILVVELWNIGDVVLMLPFLTQLRAIFPRARTTLLARPHARVILAGTGLVDEYLDDAAPRENWLSLHPVSRGWRDLWSLRRKLRERNFDLAFQCRLHVREHVILSMSRARRRIGYAFGQGDQLLTNAIVVDDAPRHKADDWMRLLDIVGGPVETEYPSLHISAEEREAASHFLSEHGVSSNDDVIGVHPGASLPEKRWPLEKFNAVARELAKKPGVRVIAFADPAGYGDALRSIDGIIMVKAGLRELMALIERCTLLVCNDSGPMHLAGALGTTTVAVFEKGIANWFAPLGPGHELVAGDDAAVEVALANIPASRVLAAVERVMAARRARGKSPA